MKKHLQSAAIAIYVGMAVVTFGHAFERQKAAGSDEARVVGSFFSAAAWPLYWSTEFWRR